MHPWRPWRCLSHLDVACAPCRHIFRCWLLACNCSCSTWPPSQSTLFDVASPDVRFFVRLFCGSAGADAGKFQRRSRSNAPGAAQARARPGARGRPALTWLRDSVRRRGPRRGPRRARG
eukprot:6983031-Pyramimonas_sp.AAC.1